MGTSDEVFSGGGTGKSTAEMQKGSTFLRAGWDFLNETANGVEDIWWILEGNDYPRLTWEEGPARVRLPRDAEMDAPRSPILRWAPGQLGRRHDVYFGDDAGAVADASVETPDVYRGRQAAEGITYDPGVLEWGKTYYWRIDEVSQIDIQSVIKGHVWSFTVTDFVATGVVVDDFEGYTPATGRALSETWVPRAGTSAYPMIEQVDVHSGRQCMAMDYKNVGGAGWYSELQRLWEVPQDWTTSNPDTLTLYFRGWTGNGLDPLYVAVEDSGGRVGRVVHPDAGAVWAMEWQKWHVALGELQAAGVDVAAVNRLRIGVGDRADRKPGGTGTIFIDDIRLTNRMP
ncbi:MAG: hypothetical protein JW955_08850 [Sedimentisphaerales bacterium]|nr:hypothetical protein [Sedimentisphaerales bacterium]